MDGRFRHLALVVLLLGCKTNYLSVTRIPSGTFAARDPVVLFSVGSVEPCKSMPAYLDLLRPSNGRTVREPVLEVPVIPIDTRFTEDDFSEHHERLIAFVVRPGKYILMPQRYSGGTVPVTVPLIEFYVLPGETVYLGELFLTVSCALNGQLVIRDQHERDVALAIKLNPEFATRSITNRLMKFGESLHFRQPGN